MVLGRLGAAPDFQREIDLGYTVNRRPSRVGLTVPSTGVAGHPVFQAGARRRAGASSRSELTPESTHAGPVVATRYEPRIEQLLRSNRKARAAVERALDYTPSTSAPVLEASAAAASPSPEARTLGVARHLRLPIIDRAIGLGGSPAGRSPAAAGASPDAAPRAGARKVEAWTMNGAEGHPPPIRWKLVSALLRGKLGDPVFGRTGSVEVGRLLSAEGSALMRYGRYSRVFRQHGPPDSLFVLLSGAVRVVWFSGHAELIEVELEPATGRAELKGGPSARHSLFGIEGAAALAEGVVEGGWQLSRMGTATVESSEALVLMISAAALPALLHNSCAAELRGLLLGRLPLLRGVGARVLLTAALLFRLRRYSEGDVLAAQGDDLSGCLFLVLRGSAMAVLLTDDYRLLEIGKISADSGAPFFGGLALAGGGAEPAAAASGGASVVASDEVWLLALRGATHAKEMTLLIPDWHERLARAAAQMARINTFRQLRDDERQLQLRLLAAQAMRAPDDGFGEGEAPLGAQRSPVRARAVAHSLFVHASRPPPDAHELPLDDDGGDGLGRAAAAQTSPIRLSRSARELQVVRQTIRSLGETAETFARRPTVHTRAVAAVRSPPTDVASPVVASAPSSDVVLVGIEPGQTCAQ